MVRRHRPQARRMHPSALVVVAVGAGLGFLAGAGPAGAAVSSVSGGAFGYRADVTVDFGGGAPLPLQAGPTPTVTLPAGGGSAMQSAVSSTLGPGGVFLTTGALNVSTSGTTGAGGTVTSSASAVNPNVFGAARATSAGSTCTSSESGTSGSTTIAGGTLAQTPTSTIDLPANPAPNTTIDGTVEGPGGPTAPPEQFTLFLNEQTTSGGVLTVNAMRFVARGPIAVGFVTLGQSRCGVSATAAATTTTRGSTATTARTSTTTGGTTTGGTTAVSGTNTNTDLARTGTEAPWLPGLALVVGAVGASRWARRRPDGLRER